MRARPSAITVSSWTLTGRGQVFNLSEDEWVHLATVGKAQTAAQGAGTYARQILNRLLIDLSSLSFPDVPHDIRSPGLRRDLSPFSLPPLQDRT